MLAIHARSGMKLPSKRCTDAELWFAELVHSLANVMPDVNRKELPACLTIGRVYKMYLEDVRKESGDPLGLTQFRRIWQSHFPEVIIPKVRSKIWTLYLDSTTPLDDNFSITKCSNFLARHFFFAAIPYIKGWLSCVRYASFSLDFCNLPSAFYPLERNRFTKCGVCLLINEHIRATRNKEKQMSWAQKKQLHMEQQRYVCFNRPIWLVKCTCAK